MFPTPHSAELLETTKNGEARAVDVPINRPVLGF